MAHNSTPVIKIKMYTHVKRKVRGKTSLTSSQTHTQTPSPLNNYYKVLIIPQKNVSMYIHILCIMHRN